MFRGAAFAGSLRAAALSLAAVLVACSVARAADAQPLPSPRPSSGDRPLVVAVFDEPPFAMRDDDGQWSGLAIELWREAARRTGLDYEWKELPPSEALPAVAAGAVDVVVGPLVVTAERKQTVDFSTPFLHVSYGIASRAAAGESWLEAMSSAFTAPVITATIALFAAMVLFGVVVWLLERRRNPEHFGGGVQKGVGEGLWWSATTMSTVGYGDRTPVTFFGRAVGIAWMFISIVAVSMFTAVVTSALTVHRLTPVVRSIADLTRVRVGSLDGSAAAEFLGTHGVTYRPYSEAVDGLRAVVDRSLDAYVDELPVLKYVTQHDLPGEDLVVVPVPAHRGFLAFALPMGSPRRQAIDVAMLEALHSAWWREQVIRYLGA